MTTGQQVAVFFAPVIALVVWIVFRWSRNAVGWLGMIWTIQRMKRRLRRGIRRGELADREVAKLTADVDRLEAAFDDLTEN
jgi:hypothetical protein